MITHCPSCELSFRISDSQLAAAGGLVRCGACLKVFNAKDHLATDQQEQATPQPVNPPQSLPPAPALSPPPSPEDDDDFFIDDNFDLTLLDQLTGTESGKQDNPAATLENRQEPQQEPQQAQEAKPMDGNPDNVLTKNSPVPDTPAGAEPPSVPPPKSVVAALKEDPPLAVSTTLPPQQADHKQAPSGPAAPQPVESTPVTGSVTPLPSGTDIAPHLTAPGFDGERFAGQDSDRVTTRRGWLWYPLLLIGIVALPLQYAYFHADILGQDPRWRPALEIVCMATRCTLAPLANLDRIATTNLVVRSHPDQAGALRVDATLLNRATFAQPFPHLTLSFENLQGEVVASRSFAPHEYLGGELKGVAVMPIQQPVKLELDILDPGPEAVSYSLSVTDSSRQ